MMTPDELDAACAPIIDAAARHHRLDRAAIFSDSHRQPVCIARHLAVYLCWRLTGASTPALGLVFKRDHSTVIHSLRVIERRYCNTAFRCTVNSMIESLRAQVAMERAA